MDQIWPTSLSCLALTQFQNTYKDIGKCCLFHPRVCAFDLSLALNSPSENNYNWKPLGYGNNKNKCTKIYISFTLMHYYLMEYVSKFMWDNFWKMHSDLAQVNCKVAHLLAFGHSFQFHILCLQKGHCLPNLQQNLPKFSWQGALLFHHWFFSSPEYWISFIESVNVACSISKRS